MSTLDYLKAYRGDLRYALSNGLSSLNFATADTQFITTEQEAEEYLKDLSNTKDTLEAMV